MLEVDTVYLHIKEEDPEAQKHKIQCQMWLQPSRAMIWSLDSSGQVK